MILASHGIIGSSIVQFVPTGNLLEDYPGAAAAYSLRALDPNNYVGSAIRVRRASDNAEQDIGFVDNELDTSTLTSFCSGTSGFVKTWYDQSGNARNATQTTASEQPQIVSSGSVILENGKPAIYSNQKRLFNSLFTTTPATTDFFIFKPNTLAASTFQAYYGGAGLISQRGYFGNNNAFTPKDIIFDGTILTGNDSTTTQKVAFILRNGSSSNFYLNGVLQASGNSGANVIFNGVSFGADYNNASKSDIYYQEFIRYDVDQSSNRTGIEANINTYYSIY